jgi:hypothetical protein
MPSSGLWRCVHIVRTDVLEERVASIFVVEKYASEKSVRRLLIDCNLLAFFCPEDGGDTFL